MVCQKNEGKTILKPTIHSFAFETVRIGPKAERLLANADALLASNASNVTVVTELPAFQAKEKFITLPRKQFLLLADFCTLHARVIQKRRMSQDCFK